MKKVKRFALLAFILLFFGSAANAVTSTDCIALEVAIQYFFDNGAYDMADGLYNTYVNAGCWELVY